MTTHRNFIRLAVIATIGVLILTLVPSLSLHKTSQAAPTAISTPATTRIIELYGALPLRFEANQGQTDSQVLYLSRNPGYDLFLTPCEAVMVLHRQQRVQSSGRTMSEPAKTDKTHASNVVRMRLVGTNHEPAITGRDKLPGKSHYFIGNERKHWHTDISQYRRVAYEGIYPGIDLAFYGTNRQLEYDFVVKPGADPKKIMIAFSGMDTIALEKNGGLILRIGNDTIVHHAPRIYQETNGEKRSIKGHYVLYEGNRAGFHIAAYDTKRPLVIDPELTYSTYLGGTNTDEGRDIIIDSDGNAYITGRTLSADFPTTLNSYQETYNNNFDAFVVKINPSGSALLFSTYLGGDLADEGYGIAIDATKNVYITGSTVSIDFPTYSPIQANNNGGKDAFIAKLKSDGSVPLFSTYFGGNNDDVGYGIAVDTDNVYITGSTESTADFPTQSPYQANNNGGKDAFIAKLNSTSSTPIFSTYFGGNNDDESHGIAIDSSENVYVTGYTYSTANFPTESPYQASNNGGKDAFIAKLNSVGSAPIFSTYFGGNNDDESHGIAIDSSENVYVTGYTYSTANFPTESPYQASNNGGKDAFIAKLNSIGSAPIFSTYLGGSNTDEGYGIAVDGNDYAYVTGTTSSSETSASPFPTTANAVQRTIGGGFDAFIAKFNTSGSSLLYSTYLGGSNDDYGQSMTVDSSENVYVTGWTESDNDFPTAGTPYQSSGNSRDAFVTKSTTTDAPTPTPPPTESGDNCFINTVFRR